MAQIVNHVGLQLLPARGPRSEHSVLQAPAVRLSQEHVQSAAHERSALHLHTHVDLPLQRGDQFPAAAAAAVRALLVEIVDINATDLDRAQRVDMHGRHGLLVLGLLCDDLVHARIPVGRHAQNGAGRAEARIQRRKRREFPASFVQRIDQKPSQLLEFVFHEEDPRRRSYDLVVIGERQAAEQSRVQHGVPFSQRQVEDGAVGRIAQHQAHGPRAPEVGPLGRKPSGSCTWPEAGRRAAPSSTTCSPAAIADCTPSAGELTLRPEARPANCSRRRHPCPCPCRAPHLLLRRLLVLVLASRGHTIDVVAVRKDFLHHR
ncbi:hypothetical protein Mapa_016027 [Marchantia paleacea]|nr:hypothetical protein Mapa_016027 [Marchantia paleacea]